MLKLDMWSTSRNVSTTHAGSFMPRNNLFRPSSSSIYLNKIADYLAKPRAKHMDSSGGEFFHPLEVIHCCMFCPILVHSSFFCCNYYPFLSSFVFRKDISSSLLLKFQIHKQLFSQFKKKNVSIITKHLGKLVA